MIKRRIILGSQSPRRERLLKQIGLDFEIRASDYEEDMQAKDEPYELAKFLALRKAEDVARHYDDAIIIAADTFVIFQDKFIGKPKDNKEAKEMIKTLAGNEHEVVTSLALIDTKTKKVVNDFSTGKVKFRKISNQEIEAYVNNFKVLDKAGAYAIQEHAAIFVESVSGDFYAIVGLPMVKLGLGLRELGVEIFS